MIRPETFVDAPSSRIPGAPIHWNISFQLPSTCPHCGTTSDPKVAAFTYLNLSDNGQFAVLSMRCPSCKTTYVGYYHVDQAKGTCEFVGMYPGAGVVEINSELLMLSPAFVEMYRQALEAEGHGHLELSAVGLLSALHVLVKDYAIKVLHKNPKKVEAKTLAQAVEKYLRMSDFVKPNRMRKLLQMNGLCIDGPCSLSDYQLLRLNYDTILETIVAKTSSAAHAVVG